MLDGRGLSDTPATCSKHAVDEPIRSPLSAPAGHSVDGVAHAALEHREVGLGRRPHRMLLDARDLVVTLALAKELRSRVTQRATRHTASLSAAVVRAMQFECGVSDKQVRLLIAYASVLFFRMEPSQELLCGLDASDIGARMRRLDHKDTQVPSGIAPHRTNPSCLRIGPHCLRCVAPCGRMPCGPA